MSYRKRKQPSDEADERQLELARAAGEAYQRSLQYMIDEVADTGDVIDASDFQVAFAQAKAEGMYRPTDVGLEWVEPEQDHNCHLEVAVCDAADGRFVPELSVTVRVLPKDGDPIGPMNMPFLWHPGLFHYGRNLSIPGDGEYDIGIHVEPPAFRRRDATNGDCYVDPVEVVFEGVELTTGRA